MYVLAKASYYLFMHAFTCVAEIGQYDVGPTVMY